MNNLININENGRSSARELYEFLGLNRANFARWCQSNIVNNKFSEDGTDYIPFFINEECGGQASIDYSLSNDFAKTCLCHHGFGGERRRCL